jgi:hypothetical protein
MKKSTFLKLIKEQYPQSLDNEYDGGCPCSKWKGIIDGKEFGFKTRCWRVSDNLQDLYIWGDHPEIQELAKALKKQLDNQEWYNPYTIIYHKYHKF